MMNIDIKRITIVLCVLLFTVLLPGMNSYAEGLSDGNLITDSDLENADDSFCEPYIGNFLGITTEKAHSGIKSVKTKVPSSWAHLVQVKPTSPLVPGQKYIISFWYYTDVEYNSSKLIAVLNNGAAILTGMTQSPIKTGEWTKYSCVFTAQEGTDNLKYIYPAVVNGSPYSDDCIMYFDDFSLRLVPEQQTVLEGSAVENNTVDNAEVSFLFNQQPEIFDIQYAISLNGIKLEPDDILVNVTKEADQYKATVKLKKQLVPLMPYEVEMSEISDVYGVKVEKNSYGKVLFNTPADVDVDAFYYKTDDENKTPVTNVVNESVSLSYRLKNNTASEKHCYLVHMLVKDNNIVKIFGVSDENVASNNQTDEKQFVLGEIPEGCYVRTFCWTSLDANQLRAFNQIIELK